MDQEGKNTNIDNCMQVNNNTPPCIAFRVKKECGAEQLGVVRGGRSTKAIQLGEGWVFVTFFRFK